ncbi:MAG: metallophosphoesterase [Clostridium sp.]
MINGNNNAIFDKYTEELNENFYKLKSFIYSKDKPFEFGDKKPFEEMDIDNLTINDNIISTIIKLGIKKGWIYSKGNIIDVGVESDFQKFLIFISNKFKKQWKAQSENENSINLISENENSNNLIFNHWLEKCYKKEYSSYYNYIKNQDFKIDFGYYLIKHMNAIDNKLLDIYFEFLTSTLIFGDSIPKENCKNELKSNELSKIVCEYLLKDGKKRIEFLKLFIVKMIVEKQNYTNRDELNKIINEIVKKDYLCIEDVNKLNNDQYKKFFKDTIPKIRCFIYKDFCEIENEIESIKEMLNSFSVNPLPLDDEIKSQIKLWKLLYDYENYEETIICEDNNIEQLRAQHPDGLHFVVGDLHGSFATLNELLKKIKYDKEKDHIYFVGDYYSTKDGDVDELINRLNEDFHADYSKPGFHLIKGNHDKELSELPNVIAIKMNKHTFYIAHAAVYNKVIDIIYTDMETKLEKSIFTYKFDTNAINSESNGETGKCYRMFFSITGNFNPQKIIDNEKNNAVFIQDTINSKDETACIIHGHTPYCYLKNKDDKKIYGEKSVFWKKQHIWFSEDMRSFDIDSNVKGHKNAERRLSCICLEIYDSLSKLKIKNIRDSENGVFSVKHKSDNKLNKSSVESYKISDLQNKIKNIDCKIITVDDKGQLVIREKNDDIN